MSAQRPLLLGNKGKALADDLAVRALIKAMVEEGIGDVAKSRLVSLRNNSLARANRYTEEADLVDTITFDTQKTAQEFTQHIDSLIKRVEDEQSEDADST